MSSAHGPLQAEAPPGEPLLEALAVLDRTPAPRGQEAAAANRLCEWCAVQWPELDWAVEPYSADGANLVASCGDGPLLYSHLDTSLDGGPDDSAITARGDDPGPLRIDGSTVEGFGVGVARAPVAAALVAFTTARRGTLLLAGSGTHRRGGRPTGLEHFLDHHPCPQAAVVAKCGPPAVLHSEPGAAYLRVLLTGSPGVALAPDSAVPPGGVVAHAGTLLDALAAWRTDVLARPLPRGQAGREIGIGAIRAGRSDKPDLLPAALELDLYAVLTESDDPHALGADLRRQVAETLATTGFAGCAVDVAVEPIHAAAATDPGAPLVRAAERSWAAEFGQRAPKIVGWTGSTDGVVLRSRGVDTVRLGPQSTRTAEDWRREVVDLGRLRGFARIYAALLRL